MPIEFRCPQCQKLLRVGDDAAGKQAKCPSCSALVPVPASSAADEFAIEPLPPPPTLAGSPFGQAGASPFGAPSLPQRPAPASDNPYAAPLTGGESVSGFVRPSTININDVFGDAWPTFKAHMGLLIAVFFVQLIIGQAVSQGGNVLVFAMQAGGADQVAIFAVQMLVAVAAGLVGLWLGSGQDLYFMQTAKGGSPAFSTLFSGHAIFLRRLLLYMLGMVAALVVFAPAAIAFAVVYFGMGEEEGGVVAGVVVGVLCLIPWIWIMLTYGQAWFVYVDQPVGTMEGIRISGMITPGNRLAMFCLWILSVLLVFAGACACGIGVLFTAPLVQMVYIITYLHMTGQPVRGFDSTTPPHMTT